MPAETAVEKRRTVGTSGAGGRPSPAATGRRGPTSPPPAASSSSNTGGRSLWIRPTTVTPGSRHARAAAPGLAARLHGVCLEAGVGLLRSS